MCMFVSVSVCVFVCVICVQSFLITGSILPHCGNDRQDF